MKKIGMIVLLLGGALCAFAPAWAQSTRYVNEDGVELYDAPSPDANIVTMLSKGAALNVLEISNSGYTRVHTLDNWEGWVVNQYLVDTQPFIEADSSPTGASPGDALPMQTGTVANTPSVPAIVTPAPATKSVRPNAAVVANHAMQTQLAEARKQLKALQSTNKLLKDQSTRNWFLTGAGVLLLGFIIGLIVPKIRWRRKSWHSY
ncbi:MAG: SH3 domain-containing protein [Gammaproteobacteria bacterium]